MRRGEPAVGLRARGIVARRGDRVVLADVDLDAAAGEIVAVTGPNGSGKSTLLEILALLRRPDAGSLELCGSRVVTAAQPIGRSVTLAMKRRVTLAMQPALLLRCTVLDNVRYGLRARGIARADTTRRAQEALDRTGVGALAERRAQALSAGERQRVNLARALALPVDVLLLDEPTANVDEAGARAIRALLRDLRAAGNRAIVVATPGDAELLALSDRIVKLCNPAPAPSSSTRVQQ